MKCCPFVHFACEIKCTCLKIALREVREGKNIPISWIMVVLTAITDRNVNSLATKVIVTIPIIVILVENMLTIQL